jgi:valyl-tRNA synthetase
VNEHLSLADRWILSRLNRVIGKVSDALAGYRFNDAAAALYKFVWHEFCDWYLEAIKPTLYGHEEQSRQEATLSVLWRVLRDTLILLHPFTPFVTEEIWQKLPGTQGSIMKAVFPSDVRDDISRLRDLEAESTMELITGIITGIRNIRGEMNIAPSLFLVVTVQAQEESTREMVKHYQEMIINLARLESFSVEKTGKRPKSAATAIVEDATIFVSLENIIDFAKETKRLEKEINKLAKELAVVSKKLDNKNFINKAPTQVVEEVKEKHRIFVEKQEKLQSHLDKIKEFES